MLGNNFYEVVKSPERESKEEGEGEGRTERVSTHSAASGRERKRTIARTSFTIDLIMKAWIKSGERNNIRACMCGG